MTRSRARSLATGAVSARPAATPDLVNKSAMRSAIKWSPRTCIAVADLRAISRTPPSESWLASDAAANTGESCSLNSCGIERSESAGKSMTAPAAASSAMTRSHTGAGTPRRLAWARISSRLRLPSSNRMTSAARRAPEMATARRESTPICTVSWSRHSDCRPARNAGLTRVSVPRGTDSSVFGEAGADSGRSPQSPGRQAVRPPSPEVASGLGPGDPLAGEVRLATPAGQDPPVDRAVNILGSARRVAVDGCAPCCELPGQNWALRPSDQPGHRPPAVDGDCQGTNLACPQVWSGLPGVSPRCYLPSSPVSSAVGSSRSEMSSSGRPRT